jgi:hypothetical protein
MKANVFVAALLLLSGGVAHARRYQVEITNGGAMPVSPAVVYVTDSEVELSRLGAAPTDGFVTLCQTGNNAPRLQELAASPAVRSIGRTAELLFPGQSLTVVIDVPDPERQSIHFEAMYGLTKDTCATFTVPGTRLRELGVHRHDKTDVAGTDLARSTGAFADPAVPMGAEAAAVCADAPSAVACLRILASGAGGGAIRAFPGYLPSVLDFLESMYGSGAAQSLMIPGGGAVRYRVTAVR